jgi:hypothetical protein
LRRCSPSKYTLLSLSQLLHRADRHHATVAHEYHSLQLKNPLCRTGNVSLSGQIDAENWGQVDNEYCHSQTADSLECALVYFSGQVFREWGACAEAMETLQDAPEGSGNSQPCCRSLTA